MCFWGGSDTQEQQTPTVVATPSPTPTPVPTETSPMETADRKRKKKEALRYGMLSTIKTGTQGVSGAGADLNSPEATAGSKNKLGA